MSFGCVCVRVLMPTKKGRDSLMGTTQKVTPVLSIVKQVTLTLEWLL